MAHASPSSELNRMLAEQRMAWVVSVHWAKNGAVQGVAASPFLLDLGRWFEEHGNRLLQFHDVVLIQWRGGAPVESYTRRDPERSAA